MPLGKEEIKTIIDTVDENITKKTMTPQQKEKRTNLIWVICLIIVTAFTAGGYVRSYSYTEKTITKIQTQFEEDEKQLQKLQTDILLIQQREADNKELLQTLQEKK